MQYPPAAARRCQPGELGGRIILLVVANAAFAVRIPVPGGYCVRTMLKQFAAAVVLSLGGIAARAALAADPSTTPVPPHASPTQVEIAINKAKAWIYGELTARGNWEQVDAPVGDSNSGTDSDQWGGRTSLAAYALLAAGDTRNDPRLAKAIDFLKAARIKGIYAIGMRCQVWLLLEDDKLKPLMQRDADILLKTIGKKGPATGFFSYYYEAGRQPPDYYDHSVSQYGVLGLWALEQSGISIPQGVWKQMDEVWRRHQDGGGWSYQYKADAVEAESAHLTPQMTAAGVATLFITQDYLQPDLGNCRANLTDPVIERGLNWIDQHIDQAINTSNLYCMYGIERIGVASGRKYFGKSNWYQRGADALIDAQAPNGSWGGSLENTCFALLFLVRGRAPVAFNKLQYENVGISGGGVEGPWNERPRDCANFARWMGHNLERDLNWQIVDMKIGADDLNDAPIVYISGSGALHFSQKQIDQLRTFVEQGGMILGNADCSKKMFADSFVQLGAQLFPNYKFRELEPSHPIYTAEQFPASRWKTHPSVLGLSNGVRELMLLIPQADLARAWQMRNYKSNLEAYQVGADIFDYSIDKKALKFRGESTTVKLDPAITTDRKLKVARLMVGDNPNPEPGGWRRLAAILHNEHHLQLDVHPIKPGQDKLTGYKIADLTGTTKFTLSPAARAQLVEFVLHGGTLVIDAAGGSKAFAEAAQAELEEMFGADAAKLAAPLPINSPVYALPEAPIRQINYRTFARKVVSGDAHSPRVRGIERGGRIAVFFSREDLCEGMVGEPVDGIVGYTPDVATQIMRNIVLYATKGGK